MVDLEKTQRLTDEQRDLVERNLGLIWRVVHKQREKRNEDDLFQIGLRQVPSVAQPGAGPPSSAQAEGEGGCLKMNRSKEARDKLVLDHQGIIRWAVNKLRINRRHREDAEAEGQLALIAAAEAWEERTTFVWFACLRVLDRLGRWWDQQRHIDTVETTAIEVVPNVADRPKDGGAKISPTAPDGDKLTEDDISSLPPNLASVLRRIYAGKTPKEVSIEDGYSHQWANKLKAEAIKALRNGFSSN